MTFTAVKMVSSPDTSFTPANMVSDPTLSLADTILTAENKPSGPKLFLNFPKQRLVIPRNCAAFLMVTFLFA